MMRNNYPGKFIVFEGTDGSGQSTQVGLLTDFLRKEGQKVLNTKEPTKDSKAGKIIEKILAKKKKVSPLKLQKLFAQDRKWHLKNIIIPALKKGEIVISDRYFFSSFSFGKADGLKLEKLYKLNRKFLKPDIVFFLNVRPDISVQRIEKRGEEKTLFEKLDRLEKVCENYKEILENFQGKSKIYFINGEKSIKEVFEEVKNKYVKESG